MKENGMITLRRIATLAMACLLSVMLMTACSMQEDDILSGVPADIETRLAVYTPTEIKADLSTLPQQEQDVVAKLVEAAAIMHELFIEQACPGHEKMQTVLAGYKGKQAEAVRAYFNINAGPWDRRFHFESFWGDVPHPDGANFYPLDLTDAEKAILEEGGHGYDSLYTMIRRDENGGLIAVPYSEYFKDGLTEAADLLREAADLTANASLSAYLKARADAFLSDDYYESDLLWMDLDSAVDLTIGPIETYEDGLFGYKAAFEAFVTVTDPVESERLDKFKGELPWLESVLPIPDEHKNMNRGSESPIRVVDEVFTAGDTRTAVQTIAFNLPNDEKVREAKGSKKVMLRNVMNAKFNRILTPIAETLIVPDQLDGLAAESFFLHTLWHEMSHGLGPGRIVKDGEQTEVRLELKDLYSTIEEAKADAMASWDIFKLQPKGYFDETIYRQQAVTYLAGLFRSVRFGIGEAHGQANAIQFNYLLNRNVITVEDGLFRIDVEAFPGAIESLVQEILMIEAEGDYAAAAEMVEVYGGMSDALGAALVALEDLPVDLLPQFSI
jgi:Peptidase family M49